MNDAETKNKTLAPETLGRLRGHSWPGNVRELRNVIQRAFIMAEEVIEVAHLPFEFTTAQAETGPYLSVRVGSTISDIERRLILATLEQYGGSKEKSAETLGLA